MYRYRKWWVACLLLHRAGHKIAVNRLLEEQEYHQRRNYTYDDSGEDDLPLSAVGSDEAVQRRGNDCEVLAWHVEVRSVEIVVDRHEFDYQYGGYRRAQHRKDNAEIHPGIACTVQYCALVKRFRYVIQELNEDVDGNDVRADVQYAGSGKRIVKP